MVKIPRDEKCQRQTNKADFDYFYFVGNLFIFLSFSKGNILKVSQRKV